MKEYFPITMLLLALIGVIYLMIDSQPNKKIAKKTNSTQNPEIIVQQEDKIDNSQAIRQRGKSLFNNYCAACHNRNMKDDLTGPALSGTVERWKNDTSKIINYLRNPEKYFRNNPSKRMIDLHKKFGKVPKPIMDELTLEQLNAIIIYIEMDNYIVN